MGIGCGWSRTMASPGSTASVTATTQLSGLDSTAKAAIAPASTAKATAYAGTQ
jgi:hypothetical protein